MMPCDALSGFDDAPTMAMVVASVSSCFSSASGGFAWAIQRAYYVSLPLNRSGQTMNAVVAEN